VKVPSMSLSAKYPSVDLMGWEGVSKFKSNYRHETNEIKEWIRSVINTAAVNFGTSKALGTIKIPIDPSDDETFMETILKAAESALKNGNAQLEKIMTSAIRDQKISDPFTSAIYRTISENSEKVYGTDVFRSNVRTSVMMALSSYYTDKGISFGTADLQAAADVLSDGDDVKRAIEGYDNAAAGCVEGLRALAEIPAGKSGTFKDICTAILQKGVLFLDFATNVPERIIALCAEAVENTNINPYSGVIELPDTDSYKLTDSNGNTSVEKISVSSISSSPDIRVKGPNDNLRDCIHYVGFNDNSGASYATAFSVVIKDRFEYVAKSSGVLESAMGVSDSVYKGSSMINLELKIVVASGWELAGVKKYDPSNNFFEDAWNVLIKLLGPILEPLRKVVSMISDALSVLGSALIELSKYVAMVIEKLYRILMEPLEMLSRFIEEKLDKMINVALEKAVDAVQWIVGIDLSKQTVGFTFMGFTLTFTTNLASLGSATKTLLTVTMSYTMDNLKIFGSVTIKQKGSGSSRELLLSGNAGIEGNTWSVAADIDPLMKSTGHMISMYGHIKGVKFDVVLPDLVQYQHAEFSLSDVPGLGAVLSNIPLPIPGLKASIDAGVNLKYNMPFKTGILINEFELNPPGTDRDNEWVEILNATSTRVDLEGYTLHAASDPQKKVFKITDLVLGPGQKEVIVFPGAFLNNSKESVILRSPDGREVDKTPAKSDSANDSRTWQRVADGAIDWAFAEGTPGTTNCGGLFGSAMVKAQIIKILQDSAVKIMGEMKYLKSPEDLSIFFQKALHHAITSGIEMLAACLVEAAIFVSLDITDASSTICGGVRISLFIDSGFIEEGLKYLVGEIESILLNIENPFGLRPLEILTDNLYLGVTLYFGLTTPKYLKGLDLYPKVRLGIHINTNVSGLCRIVGADIGKWKVTAGVLIMDCPTPLIPSVLKPDMMLESDLWLLRATFTSV
ncbi:MAG: lamin tail domain-containing protein, partial [Methanomassiliicoccaceae archaeon]|nr:lamin tail domain-containing protein [Methanomassiliicoccaceae archaeon]